jgi:HEAT repeat protein
MDDSQKIDEFIGDLENPDKRRLRAAVDALTPLAADSPGVRARLNVLLSEPQRKNRWAIAYILGSLSNPAGETLRVLHDTLESPDSDIRWAVALLLVRLGKTVPKTVPPLLELSKTGNPIQRRMAIYCIRDLRLEDEIAVPALLKALIDDEPLVRVAAVTSLKLRHGLNAEGKDLLLKVFLADPDLRVRSAAAITLAELAPASEEFLNALQTAAASENAQTKKAALAAFTLLEKRRPAPTGS